MVAVFIGVTSFLTLILLLVLASTPCFAGVSISAWAKEPIVRFVATSFLMQPESLSELQKSAAVINHLESAVLGGRKIPIQSFDEYLARRDHMPDTMQEYQKAIQQFGFINPLNIATPNSEVFEKIVEFEVRYFQRLLESWPERLNQSYDMVVLRQTMQSMLLVYQMGLGLRNGIDHATQSWEGVFGLGLLRAIGKNVVNPMVRSMIYSDSVLNRLRNELRKQFVNAHSALSQNFDVLNRDFQSHGRSMIENILVNDMAELEVMRTFKNLDATIVFELMQSFVKTMPLELKQDLVWTFLKSPTDQPVEFASRYPNQIELTAHFLNWIQSAEIKREIKALHPLPLWEMAHGMALVIRENLAHSDQAQLPRVLGEFTQRSWLGLKKASVKIVLEQHSDKPIASATLTLVEFESKFPEQAEFLKKRLADVVIHNAFGFGLRSNLTDEVRIITEDGSKDIKVQLSSAGILKDHPLDRPDQFVDDLSRITSRELLAAVARVDDVKTSDWGEIYEKQSPESRQKLKQFLGNPENLRWGLQMYQLKKMVGENIIRDQMKLYFLKRPNLVMSFIYKKWKQRSGSISVQSNQCLQFYTQ